MSIYICNGFMSLTLLNGITLQCILFITHFIPGNILSQSYLQVSSHKDSTLEGSSESSSWYPCHCVVPSHWFSAWPYDMLGQWDISKHIQMEVCKHLHIRAYLPQAFLFESRCHVMRQPKQLCGGVVREQKLLTSSSPPIAPEDLSGQHQHQGYSKL